MQHKTENWSEKTEKRTKSGGRRDKANAGVSIQLHKGLGTLYKAGPQMWLSFLSASTKREIKGTHMRLTG